MTMGTRSSDTCDTVDSVGLIQMITGELITEKEGLNL